MGLNYTPKSGIMRTGLNVYIKVDKLKQFRAACRQLDITASRKAVELIEAWLAQFDKVAKSG